MKTYSIEGEVIHEQTDQGIRGLRVEAWDKDTAGEDDLLGEDISDELGSFTIDFDEQQFSDDQNLPPHEGPDIYCKVFQDERLLKDTEQELINDVSPGTVNITIKISSSVLGLPAPPTGITVRPGDSQVEIQWDQTAGVDSYNLYWANNPEVSPNSGAQIAVENPPFTHAELTNDTTYYYVITAINEVGESAPSERVSATPKPIQTVPAAPSSVTAIAGDTKIDLQWREVSNAESYNLYWSTSPDVSVNTGTQITDVWSPYTHKERTNGTTYYYVLTAINEVGESAASQKVSATPKASGISAPELDQTVASTMNKQAEFLYTGEDPPQKGVTPDSIEAKRVAVLRGRVQTRQPVGENGKPEPIADVRITIHRQDEFGYTTTRTDGMFDLAVNGGGQLTIRYEKGGYLPAQREITAPWQDYTWLPDVALIPIDEEVSTIDLTADDTQVARGSPVTDSDGDRQPTLLFPAETTGPAETLDVRLTEYTVGPDGPNAMPDELPPTSGYTYAVEFTADDIQTDDIEFDPPLMHYVENFLGFPVGGIVPVGYYDREKATWIPSDNGRVIEILDIINGVAELDIDGSGQPADVAALNDLTITEDERRKLAQLYSQPGQSLWRVPIPHFSPWDCNWPYGPPADARSPNQIPRSNNWNWTDNSC